MKICWDNLEKLRYNKKTDRWYGKGSYYVYVDSCEYCGEPFLSQKGKGRFCDQTCFKKSDEYVEKIKSVHTGKKLTKEHIEIISKIHKGKTVTQETRNKMSEISKDGYKNGRKHPLLGKHHSEETKKKLSNYKGRNTSNWKGGVIENKIPLYDTYASQLDWCEEVRRNPDNPNILEVRCTHCNKWFIPTLDSTRRRVGYFKGYYNCEYRFYCSDKCKCSCSIYGKTLQTLMKEDAIRAGRLKWVGLDREVQHELRQMVLERDNHTCRKCGATDKPLHCHHIEPVAINPIESADMDNCMTLCTDCHKEVHQKEGCKYGQLRIDVC
jgi:5-methylcytosine-specific restriction endonuclease McrA